MMDTVLSLGMNDEVAAALVKKSGNPRWVWDTYRRFIQVLWCTACARSVKAGRMDG